MGDCGKKLGNRRQPVAGNHGPYTTTTTTQPQWSGTVWRCDVPALKTYVLGPAPGNRTDEMSPLINSKTRDMAEFQQACTQQPWRRAL